MDSKSGVDPNSNATIPDHNVLSEIGLYKHSRFQSVLSMLASKPIWSLSDTASFDHLHIGGTNTLDICASKLALQSGARILDIGSGLGATGRYLATTHRVHVTGIELQKTNHLLAEMINSKNEDPLVVGMVRSVNADFLKLEPATLGEPAQFNHAVSILCICHLPEDSRVPFLKQAARFVKLGGTIYIEDLFRIRDGPLDAEDAKVLRDVNGTPHLPSKTEYMGQLNEAGFGKCVWEDVSAQWTGLTRERADKYKALTDKSADLELFYDVVAEKLAGGSMGGVRIVATQTTT
ncbi:MAG: hypothetical protein LQ350_004069 [Teloschistes chrysophthalmus]|nr:MAG: hypothetical protein LQ350_004069 [Niorma chrysophthalma]